MFEISVTYTVKVTIVSKDLTVWMRLAKSYQMKSSDSQQLSLDVVGLAILA